jgi:AAA family ATP:ADP antiporter
MIHSANSGKAEQLLLIFTKVKRGEGKIALLMFTNIFFILTAYYLVKPLREGWIAVSYITSLSKMEIKAYSSFLQALTLLIVTGLFGRLSDKLNKTLLITGTTFFFIVNILIFWILQPGFIFKYVPGSAIIYYVWVGVFGLFVVAQFWTFCADSYNNKDGSRLLPFIAAGATAGAVFGSRIVNFLLSNNLLSINFLLPVAIIPLLISIFLLHLINLQQTDTAQKTEKQTTDDSCGLKAAKDWKFILNGAEMIFKSRIFLFIAIITILNNWVNTNGENLMFQVVQNNLKEQALLKGITENPAVTQFIRDQTTIFYGSFFFWVNIIALFLQSIVASRLLKYGGFASILLALPVIAIISYTAMAFMPVLLIVKIMKTAENATDYSINNTARHVLWLPFNSETKFHGKPAIDTLYVRLGDGLAALTVLTGVQLFVISITGFFILNIFLVLLWLLFAILLIKERKKLKNC